MKGLWIVWSNIGGELSREFVREGDSEIEALISMIHDAGELRDGDTIRIVEGESND